MLDLSIRLEISSFLALFSSGIVSSGSHDELKSRLTSRKVSLTPGFIVCHVTPVPSFRLVLYAWTLNHKLHQPEPKKMFTCISCRVAFDTAAEQRTHFFTDWHRYNMKRRFANLPPVAAIAFNEKVFERREQNAVRLDPRDLFCSACR